MSKDKYGIEQNPIQEKITKYSAWNPFADKGNGLDDEYYINEIIGIDELPYEEFIKEEKDAK